MKRPEFDAAMSDLQCAYGRELARPTLAVWWKRFQRFSARDFRQMLDDASMKSGFMPGFGHVLEASQRYQHEQSMDEIDRILQDRAEREAEAEKNAEQYERNRDKIRALIAGIGKKV